MAAGARDEGRGRLAPARPPARRVPSLPPHLGREDVILAAETRPVSASLGTRPRRRRATMGLGRARPLPRSHPPHSAEDRGGRPGGLFEPFALGSQAPRGARSSGAPEQATRTPTRDPRPLADTGAAGRAPTIVILTSVRSSFPTSSRTGRPRARTDDTAGRWDRLPLGDLIATATRRSPSSGACVRCARSPPCAAITRPCWANFSRSPSAHGRSVVATLKVHADALDGGRSRLAPGPSRTNRGSARGRWRCRRRAGARPSRSPRVRDYLLGVRPRAAPQNTWRTADHASATPTCPAASWRWRDAGVPCRHGRPRRSSRYHPGRAPS